MAINNPNAYPVPVSAGAWYSGMTLRDYFAGQVLAGWMASFLDDASSQQVEVAACESIAAMCYRLADAMLAERNK